MHRLIQSSKLILFDHDDTLVGTIKAKWAQHKFIAKTFYGKKLTDDQIRLHWGKPLTVLMKLLYEADHIDIAMSYNIATRSKFPKKLFEGTVDTLVQLKKMGKKLGLVTATTNSSLQHDFQTLKIPKELFDYVQTEDDTTVHKPDPRVFELALEWASEQNIQPHEIVCVGDHLSDMAAAHGASLAFIGVGTGLIPAKEFEKHGVDGLSKLPDLLKSSEKPLIVE